MTGNEIISQNQIINLATDLAKKTDIADNENISGIWTFSNEIYGKSFTPTCYTISGSGSSDINKWTKICRVTLNYQYQSVFSIIKISSIDNYALVYNTELMISFKQNNIMGGLPVGEIVLLNSKIIQASDIVGIVSQNDSNSTIIDIYIKYTQTYNMYRYFILRKTSSGSITFLENQSFITTLPSGTQFIPSYLSSTLLTTQAGGTDSGNWTKIASLKITARYQQQTMKVEVSGGAEGSANRYESATLKIRLKQQNAMGGAPVVNILVSDNNILTSANFLGILSQNDTTATNVDIYIKYSTNYQQYTLNIIEFGGLGTGLIYSGQSILATGSLPSGTQYTTSYQDSNLNTITSAKFQLSALNTAPASATATGTTGEIRITADYIYVCTATNTWKRTALTTW